MEGLKKDLIIACQKDGGEYEHCNQKMGEQLAGNASNGAPDFFKKLATSDKETIFWQGMWDGAGSDGRTTKQALFDFANLVDNSTVYPTELGKMVEKHGDLQQCSKDPAAFEKFTIRPTGLLQNFYNLLGWTLAQDKAQKLQKKIVIIVNNDIDPQAEHSFQKSVLYNYELRWIAKEVGFTSLEENSWRPQVMIVDLKGTCDEMKKAMKGRLTYIADVQREASSIKAWLFWKPLRCLPCAGSCKLDLHFAEKVKKELNRKWYNLR